MNKLENITKELTDFSSQLEVTKPEISAASIGWHIEHTLLVTNSIINVLKKSDPNDYKWKFNFPRTLIFMTRKIPRGRAKAPKSVQPTETISQESLQNHVTKVQEKLKELNSLNPKNSFDHPYFGKLNVAQTVQFLNIHTQHHLNIVKDIAAK